MEHPRTRAASITVSLTAGLLLGLVGPVSENWDNLDSVSLVFSGGWSWVCYAFLVGYFYKSKIDSALMSSLGLVIGVVAYYLFKYVNPAAPAGLEFGASSEGLLSRILAWGIAAFVLGVPVGIMGNLARVSGVRGLPFRLIVPLAAFLETSMRLAVEADGQGPVVGVTWSVIRFAAGVVALALVSHTGWSWWHARRVRSPEGEEHHAKESVASV
ncbi:hypothetical protein IQ279_19205 [Streptomyces verrucosisporus]|uniref:hypothetical protein n=1 Tax=Streptomyces verrucosisporus TaxID=1695161 RepID=UPI0019CFC9E4|nr:hypothetical protein [Streptomyces verrucosisporus]MBN3931730.1 hypothetical protein [Streptomyces verrucosisporus]